MTQTKEAYTMKLNNPTQFTNFTYNSCYWREALPSQGGRLVLVLHSWIRNSEFRLFRVIAFLSQKNTKLSKDDPFASTDSCLYSNPEYTYSTNTRLLTMSTSWCGQLSPRCKASPPVSLRTSRSSPQSNLSIVSETLNKCWQDHCSHCPKTVFSSSHA